MNVAMHIYWTEEKGSEVVIKRTLYGKVTRSSEKRKVNHKMKGPDRSGSQHQPWYLKAVCNRLSEVPYNISD